MQSSGVVQQHPGATAAPTLKANLAFCKENIMSQTGGLGFWQQWDIDGLDRA